MKECLVLVFALFALPGVDGFECYYCAGCYNRFSGKFISTSLCWIKQCGVTQYTISVSCAHQSVANKNCETTPGVEVCYCETEQCEGSSSVGTSLKMAAEVAIITLQIHLYILG